MASDLRGYSADEVLNKVLNTSNDSIKVDIIAGAEYAEDAAHTTADTGNFILGVRNDTLGTLGGTNGDYVPFQMNASGALYVEAAVESGQIKSGAIASGAVASGAIASGAIAAGAVAVGAVVSGAVLSGAYASGSIADGAMVTLGAKADAKNAATDGTAITAMQVLKQISSSVQILEDWDDSDLANVNLNLSGSDADKGEGVLSSQTLRVSLATDDDGVTHLATIAGAVSTQMQVDVVAALPAGNNNIGNVDIVTLPASTNTIEVVGDVAEDAAVSGFPVLTGGRYDATQRTLDDGDVGALALDPSGALYTREYTGQDGAVYTTSSSDAIKPPTGKAWVAIQMLEDTTFDSTTGLIAVTPTRWFNTADAAGDQNDGAEDAAEGSGGLAVSNSVTFPQGMTIFGRWNEIDVNSGSVIAYIGDY